MPVYGVKGPAGTRLVRATTKAVAVNHVIKDTFTAEPITADELIDLQGQGITVETASSKVAEAA